jgi:hypothetical protein
MKLPVTPKFAMIFTRSAKEPGFIFALQAALSLQDLTIRILAYRCRGGRPAVCEDFAAAPIKGQARRRFLALSSR